MQARYYDPVIGRFKSTTLTLLVQGMRSLKQRLKSYQDGELHHFPKVAIENQKRI